MGETKNAADKPGGNRPPGTNEKSHAKPDDNQLKIDLCRHLNLPLFSCPNKTTSQSVLMGTIRRFSTAVHGALNRRRSDRTFPFAYYRSD